MTLTILPRTFFFFGVLLLPLYVGASGGIQISHALIAIACLLSILSYGVRIQKADIYVAVLVLFAFFRESAEIVVYGAPPSSLMPSVYLLYNLILFVVGRSFFSQQRELSYFKFALFLGAIIAVYGLISSGFNFRVGQEYGRGVGTFNNPNQLGYFAVCLFSISVLLYLRRVVSLSYLLFFIGCSLFLSIASLSKAAMVSVFFSASMLGYILIPNSRIKIISGFLLFLAFVAVLNILLNGESFQNLSFVSRLLRIGQDSDDNLGGRGYNLVEYMNAAEVFLGLSDTVVREIRGSEVHSTIGWVFINYGVFAGLIFLFFLYAWFKRLVLVFGFFPAVIISGPPMLYGLTHNGIRFTFFWILVAISFSFTYAVSSKIDHSRKRKESGSLAGSIV